MICAFYSFTGNSALAQSTMLYTASELAGLGFRVLVIDMDLVQSPIGPEALGWNAPGVLEHIQEALLGGEPPDASQGRVCQRADLNRFNVLPARYAGAGAAHEAFKIADSFDTLCDDYHLDEVFERWRAKWRDEWHFVLIHSPPRENHMQTMALGVLPDVVVPFIGPNEPEVPEVLRRAELARQQLAPQRGRAWTVPVPLGGATMEASWYDWWTRQGDIVPDDEDYWEHYPESPPVDFLRIPGDSGKRVAEDLALLLANGLQGSVELLQRRRAYEQNARERGQRAAESPVRRSR